MGIRIGLPFLRVRVSSRGVRVGAGPRIARVHVGTGRPGISSSVGPVGAYVPLAPKRRRKSGESNSKRVAQRSTPSASGKAKREVPSDPKLDRLVRIGLKRGFVERNSAGAIIAGPTPWTNKYSASVDSAIDASEKKN